MEQTNNQPTEQRTVVHGKGRGFLSMTPEQRSAIASKGGRAAHALGRAHKWSSEEAQAAGRKGGSISRRGRRMTAGELTELHARIVQQIEAES
jgi:general stress protein YciG